MTPEFLPKLIKFLQATKADPKYSRPLANFVCTRQAYKIVRFTYDGPFHEVLSTAGANLPGGRFSPDALMISDREDILSGDGYLHGATLQQVLYGGARVYTRAATGYTLEEDVTLQFWESYMAIGKCALDHQHTYFGDPDRASERFEVVDGQTIRCRWCHDTLHLHRSLRIRADYHHHWGHASVDATGAETFRCTRCHRRYPICDLNQSITLQRQEVPLERPLCLSCSIAATLDRPAARKLLLPNEVIQTDPPVSLG